jgi:hypothetical protein
VVDVRKTRSPQTMGDDQPSPGTAVFHLASAAFHYSGKSFSLEIPWRVGPRKHGQFSPCTGNSVVTALSRMTRIIGKL